MNVGGAGGVPVGACSCACIDRWPSTVAMSIRARREMDRRLFIIESVFFKFEGNQFKHGIEVSRVAFIGGELEIA